MYKELLAGQIIPAPEHVIIKGEPEYEVEEVLDSHMF
jgi:hypothetical protein